MTTVMQMLMLLVEKKGEILICNPVHVACTHKTAALAWRQQASLLHKYLEAKAYNR
jgi:hypothetical protein